MQRLIILRYSEIHLKGSNRGFFEKCLYDNTVKAIEDIKATVEKGGARYIVKDYDAKDEKKLISRLTKVFGYNWLSVALCVENDPDKILQAVNEIKISNCTFRVTTRRADKNFPISSNEFSAMVGEIVLKNNVNLKVNLDNFDKELKVDIRENGYTFLYLDSIKCVGGMPTGCAGKAICLLSGGIDSPVAIYKIAKRGAKIYAVHFHSYPYTSERAKQKVVDLAKILSQYCGKMKLYCVSFTKVQEEIHKKCDPKLMITIMRRIMMRVTEKLAHRLKCKAIVTGESLGQVASQTMEGIMSSNSVVSMPVFRPLIGDDKNDIIEVAKQIGTFDTSILPYEDCCTVFLPRNPIIKPQLDYVAKQEQNLDIEQLVKDCLKNIEIIEINP